MVRRNCIEKTLVMLGLIFIFISSPVGSIAEYKYVSAYLFRFGGIFITIAAFSSIMRKNIPFSKPLKLFSYLYGGFVSLLIVSIIMNQSLEVEVFTLERFITVFFILSISLSFVEGISEKIITNSLIISLGIVFIYFLIEYPLSELGGAYSGGFNNPNTLGVLAATFAGVSFVASANSLKQRRNYLLAVLYCLTAIGGSYLVVISNSRTAFITLVIIVSIVLITFIYEELHLRNLLSWKSLFIVLGLAFGGIILVVVIENPVYAILESNIIDKFKRKMNHNGITDGRTIIWMDIIRDASLFGEVEYFKDYWIGSAHNGFLQVVIQYGWLAGVAYFVFWITMLLKSVQHYITEKSTNAYAILPLIAITNFILLSTAETVQFYVSTFIALSMVAIISRTNSKSRTT